MFVRFCDEFEIESNTAVFANFRDDVGGEFDGVVGAGVVGTPKRFESWWGW